MTSEYASGQWGIPFDRPLVRLDTYCPQPSARDRRDSLWCEMLYKPVTYSLSDR